jgi:hypothetical protein
LEWSYINLETSIVKLKPIAYTVTDSKHTTKAASFGGENSCAVSQKGMQSRSNDAWISRFEKEKECQRGNFENEKHEAVI